MSSVSAGTNEPLASVGSKVHNARLWTVGTSVHPGLLPLAILAMETAVQISSDLLFLEKSFLCLRDKGRPDYLATY